MTYDPDKHHRRSKRLKSYDYSTEGAYFITICTYGRLCLFGEISNSEMQLNSFGLVVKNEWLKTPELRTEIILDEFVIMPNHFHAILIVDSTEPDAINKPHIGAALRRNSKSLGSVMAGFKSAVTKQINQLRATPRVPVWQANYYEHVIRSEESVERIREYISNNPAKWAEDEENPLSRR